MSLPTAADLDTLGRLAVQRGDQTVARIARMAHNDTVMLGAATVLIDMGWGLEPPPRDTTDTICALVETVRARTMAFLVENQAANRAAGLPERGPAAARIEVDIAYLLETVKLNGVIIRPPVALDVPDAGPYLVSAMKACEDTRCPMAGRAHWHASLSRMKGYRV